MAMDVSFAAHTIHMPDENVEDVALCTPQLKERTLGGLSERYPDCSPHYPDCSPEFRHFQRTLGGLSDRYPDCSPEFRHFLLPRYILASAGVSYMEHDGSCEATRSKRKRPSEIHGREINLCSRECWKSMQRTLQWTRHDDIVAVIIT
eukprot:5233414-Amphidinium_carterae.3